MRTFGRNFKLKYVFKHALIVCFSSICRVNRSRQREPRHSSSSVMPRRPYFYVLMWQLEVLTYLLWIGSYRWTLQMILK